MIQLYLDPQNQFQSSNHQTATSNDIHSLFRTARTIVSKVVAIEGEKENQQEKSKDQLVELLLDNLPHALFYQDPSGRLLGCNKNFEMMTGKQEAEIIGRLPWEFLSEQIASCLETNFSTLSECYTVCGFEAKMIVGGNQRNYFGSYLGCGDISIEFVIGSITDITEVIQSCKESITQLERIHEIEKAVQAAKIENLKVALNFKQRELGVSLELLIHSRNVKQKLIEEVTKLQAYLTSEGKAKLNSLRKQLLWEINQESGLNIEMKFDEANTELYCVLERICPTITKNEKRLCAYLKMNHCGADIAKITNKSLNSIHVGLARLRAKLRLPNTKDLRTYLYEIS